MKEFNLELAKQGKPVCTRDGCKARIICFDRKCAMSIIALYKSSFGDTEFICSYYETGRHYSNKESTYDLMMAEENVEIE